MPTPVHSIEEVFRRAHQGVLRPFLCRASDGRDYYVKGHGAGIPDLLAEYVCGCLAHFLELPVPPFAFLESSSELISYSSIQGIEELGSGICFGSMAVEGCQELTPTTVRKVPEALQQSVLLFDWWVQNEDRHLTQLGGNPNLLWDLEQQSLVVIDHNSAFDPEFAPAALASHTFAAQLPVLSDASFQKTMTPRLLKAAAELDAILANAPESWRENPGDFDIDRIRRILNRPQSSNFWNLQS